MQMKIIDSGDYGMVCCRLPLVAELQAGRSFCDYVNPCPDREHGEERLEQISCGHEASECVDLANCKCKSNNDQLWY
jgi:hypothetical protein